MKGFNKRCLEHIFGICALAGGGAQTAPYRGEQTLAEVLAQFFERLPVPILGPFDEPSFSSFVLHSRVHFICISLEPTKALAETKKNILRFHREDGHRAGPIVQGGGAYDSESTASESAIHRLGESGAKYPTIRS